VLIWLVSTRCAQNPQKATKSGSAATSAGQGNADAGMIGKKTIASVNRTENLTTTPRKEQARADNKDLQGMAMCKILLTHWYLEQSSSPHLIKRNSSQSTKLWTASEIETPSPSECNSCNFHTMAKHNEK
jgi:hypothetical protein